MMNPDGLVQIFIDTGDPNGNGVIATGYPIAPDRVMTAYHTLHDNAPKSIALRWYHQNGTAGAWQPPLPFTDDILAWWDQDLDVALITCNLPLSGIPFAPLSPHPAKPHRLWNSEGFPDAGKRDDERHAVGMQGKTYADPHGDQQNWFELGVDHPPQDADQWKGASGAPVFSEGKIIGIIRSYQQPFGGNRFKATPMWRLLRDPDFCRALGQNEGKLAWKAWALDQLVGILKPSETHCQTLAHVLELECSQPYGVAEFLLEDDPEGFERLSHAFIDLAEQASQDFLACLKSILAIVFPTRLPPEVIASMRRQNQDVTCVSVEIPVVTKEAAEAAMVGFEQRPMEIVTDSNHPNNVRMKAALSIEIFKDGIEVGIDADEKRFLDAVTQHLIDLTAVKARLPLNQSVDNQLLAAAANKELAFLSKKKNRTHYYICNVPSTQVQHRGIQNAKALNDLFP